MKKLLVTTMLISELPESVLPSLGRMLPARLLLELKLLAKGVGTTQLRKVKEISD